MQTGRGTPQFELTLGFFLLSSFLFLQKYKEYLNGSNLIIKLEAKHELLKQTLGEGRAHCLCIPQMCGSTSLHANVAQAFQMNQTGQGCAHTVFGNPSHACLVVIPVDIVTSVAPKGRSVKKCYDIMYVWFISPVCIDLSLCLSLRISASVFCEQLLLVLF